MVLKWTREMTQVMIDLLRNKVCLWDPNNAHYTNREKRENALKTIAMEVAKTNAQVTVNDIRSKIHILRTQYRKEYNIIEESKRVAANGKSDKIRESTLWCYELLDFLLPVMKNAKPRAPRNISRHLKYSQNVSRSIPKTIPASVQPHSCWIYFTRTTADEATCNLCKANLYCNKKPSILVDHLHYRHQITTTYTDAENSTYLVGRKEVRVLDSELKNDEKLSTANSTFDPLEIVKNEDGIEINDYCINAATEQDSLDEETSLNSLCEFQTETFNEAAIEEPSSNNANNIESANTEYREAEIASKSSQDNAEEFNHQLLKLKAETRYYNEMADLAQAKRINIELQSEKLRLELAEMHNS